MKNKKIYLTITAIVILLIIILICIFINFKEEENNDAENISAVSNENSLPSHFIQSSSENPIEMNGIEATTLKITNISGQLEVVTTLKNKTNEAIHGFFIEIALLDKEGNTVTSIAENSQKEISANGKLTLTNYVTDVNDKAEIVNAKILYLEKSTIQDSIENSFNEMQ